MKAAFCYLSLFIITPCELADFVGGALHPASLSRYARGAISAATSLLKRRLNKT
jgi:hypothetical protein